MAKLKKVQLLKELKTELKTAKQTLKTMKSKGMTGSLAYSFMNSLVKSVNAMVKKLNTNVRTTKVTKADISSTIGTLQTATTETQADIRYIEEMQEDYEDYGGFDFQQFDLSTVYSIARELIEEGYGSDYVIALVNDVNDKLYPSSWSREDLKQEMINLYKGYAEDINQKQEERKRAFEKGFKTNKL